MTSKSYILFKAPPPSPLPHNGGIVEDWNLRSPDCGEKGVSITLARMDQFIYNLGMDLSESTGAIFPLFLRYKRDSAKLE